ncbi:MAG: 3-carboxy-cis,cis-muconate cycloisomerase [Gammaproteobacteria bacterium]
MALDSLTDTYLASPALAACFGAEATVAQMLAFEAALAAAQAGLGLIPAAAASAIEAGCRARPVDVAAVLRDTAASSTPAIPLVQQLTVAVAARDGAAAHYVHWGATSQDVMDTALMLAAREGLDLLGERLAQCMAALAELAHRERDTLMVARTLAQHALPTTFGYKAALWLNALLDLAERAKAARARLPLQFGGAAGTLAAYGQAGPALRDALAAALGLTARLPWHTDRTVVRELAALLAALCSAAGKIGHDLVLEMQSEVAELQEGGGVGRGGSSAMPHKRNPVAAMAVTAVARRAPGLLATVFASFDHDHERASGAWHAEWLAMRELFVAAGAALEQLAVALTGLEVRADVMRAHLDAGGGRVMAEAASMALAPALGRVAAQAVVKRALARVGADCSLATALAAEPEVRVLGDALDLARLLDPRAYLGAAREFTDQVLARHAASL